MKTDIEKLYAIAKKPSRQIIGLMSGTSLDGLDIALCEIAKQGFQTKATIRHFETIDYREDFKKEVRKIFAKKTIRFQNLVLLNEWIAIEHATMVLEQLKQWKINPTTVDLIASHGQTVLHSPKTLHKQKKFPNATLQIGDGDHIATKTGIITISDFRQKHLAAGGDGAPLASYGDSLLFSDSKEDRILLNLGGIANFTYLPANKKNLLVSDTGTGNTLIDAFTRLHFPDKKYDENAILASQGKINQQLVDSLLDDAFFSQPLPKTTGPELFNLSYLSKAQKKSNTQNLSVYDILASLTYFSAYSVATAIKPLINKNTSIYVSGGGFYNPLLQQYLKDLLQIPIKSTNSLGIEPNAKEALLFAVLANETVAGKNTNFIGMPNISMGKISLPN